MNPNTVTPGTQQTSQVQQQAVHPEQQGSGTAGVLLGSAVVQVPDPLSMIADAAEEMSFAADNEDEQELEDRKEKKFTDKNLIERVQLYEELMQNIGKSEAFASAKSALHKMSQGQNALSLVREYFGDVTEQWTVLQTVLAELESDTYADPATKMAVAHAIDELERTSKTDIAAGLHASLVMDEFALLGAQEQMVSMYRHTVHEYANVAAVFEYVQTRYAGEDFSLAIDFLFKALSADIQSAFQSLGIAHLTALHGNLAKVRHLQNIHLQCTELAGRWEEVHHVDHKGDFTAAALVDDMIFLSREKFLGSSQIDDMLTKAHAVTYEQEVLVRQEFIGMIRLAPVAFFESPEARMNVMDAVQQTLDEAISREDEVLAAGGRADDRTPAAEQAAEQASGQAAEQASGQLPEQAAEQVSEES